MGRPLLIAFISFLFIMLVVRPVVLALVRPKVEAGEVLEGLEGLPAAEEQYALYEAQEQEARAAEENARALSEMKNGRPAYRTLNSVLSLMSHFSIAQTEVSAPAIIRCFAADPVRINA